MRVPQDEIILNWVHDYFFKTKEIIIFDVGTNMGDYIKLCTSSIAGKIKEIHGFEPNKEIFLAACENFKNDSRIKIHNIALGANEEIDKDLIIPGKIKEINGEKVWKQDAHVLASLVDRPIWHTWNDCTLGTQKVNVTTVDNFVKNNSIEKIDYLKIDVEGLELDVLKGATETLKSGIVAGGQFEYGGTFQDAGITLGQVVKFLNEHGYNVYDEPNLFGDGVSPNVADDYTWSNIVFKKRKK